MKSTGDKYNTDEFGPVQITDVYISIKNQERLYEVVQLNQPEGILLHYYLTGASLLEEIK